MKDLFASLAAALVATVVLSVLMMAKTAMGLMPELNVIAMLAGQMNAGPAAGWTVHVLIGVVGYGLAWALLFRRLPVGGHAVRGVVLGVVGWLVMIAVMPMAGAGLFGLSIGAMAPVATLVLHAVFGLALGLSFGLLRSAGLREAQA